MADKQIGYVGFSRRFRYWLAMHAAMGVSALFIAAPAPTQAQTGAIIDSTVRLEAFDGVDGDRFGVGAAISGDTIFTGAPFHRVGGVPTGVGYIFVRDTSGVWTLQTELLAPNLSLTMGDDNGNIGDRFGGNIAISGDTAIISADLDNDSDACALLGPLLRGSCYAGSAYIYVRDASGAWTLQAKLLPSDHAPKAEFGHSVAISEDSASVVVGANRADDACPGDLNCESGSAYVFTRDANNIWTEQAKLLASDAARGAHFGFCSSISGDTVVIGSPFIDNDGSAYVYVRDANGVWTQQAKLLASDGTMNDQFGYSAAIIGDTVIVGAPNGSNTNGDRTGAVYTFVRDAAGVWTQQAKLLASDGSATDDFGFSVGFRNNTLVVGAIGADIAGNTNAGAVYVFARDAMGAWMEKNKLVGVNANGGIGDKTGSPAGISGGTVIAGAYGFRFNGNQFDLRGAAYVFDLPQGSLADLNGDGVVDGADIAILLTQSGAAGSADLNGDGVVDGADLAILLYVFGPAL